MSTMPSWMKGVLITIVVVPALIFSWNNIQAIWAAPEKVSILEKKVDKHEESQDQIAKLVVEQQARIDKNDAVTQAHLDALKQQMEYLAELKKRK